MIAAQREPFLAVMREVYGSAMSEQEFDWWFDRNPVGPRLVTASEDDGQVLGISAMSFFRRPSACHNTIRARVPTAADTSAPVVRAHSSAR